MITVYTRDIGILEIDCIMITTLMIMRTVKSEKVTGDNYNILSAFMMIRVQSK
jgi:hypothetical protein